MSFFIPEEVIKPFVGPQSTGPSGFGVHYNPEGGANFEASTGTAALKLDEGSVARAVEKSKGSLDETTIKHLDSSVRKSDSVVHIIESRASLAGRYNTILNRVGYKPKHLYNYRVAMLSQDSSAKNLLLREKQKRRYLALRATFDQMAKIKKVVIRTESLPQQSLEKMAESALNSGMQMTPLGSIDKAKKILGIKSPKKAAVKRQWALFVNPEMIPSGYITD